MQMQAGQFDRGGLTRKEAAASTVAKDEAHIAAFERKVGLTLELKIRGHFINHKRVSRGMRETDMQTHHQCRFKPAARSESNLKGAFLIIIANHPGGAESGFPDQPWPARGVHSATCPHNGARD